MGVNTHGEVKDYGHKKFLRIIGDNLIDLISNDKKSSSNQVNHAIACQYTLFVLMLCTRHPGI
jgi:hypothetical protein